MMKHTPGPLAITGPSSGRGPNDDGGDYAIIDTTGAIIAETFHKVGHGRERPAYENARLFIAAPELLEAAKQMVAWSTDPRWTPESNLTYETLEGLEAAIARAEGQS